MPNSTNHGFHIFLKRQAQIGHLVYGGFRLWLKNLKKTQKLKSNSIMKKTNH